MKGVKESSKLAISQGRKFRNSEAVSPSGKFTDTTAPSAAKCVLGKTGGQSPFPLRLLHDFWAFGHSCDLVELVKMKSDIQNCDS